jgi:hypothetical protein
LSKIELQTQNETESARIMGGFSIPDKMTILIH